MNKTKIETAEYTWNPVTGCDKICFDGDCYAYQLMQRFGNNWGYDWKPRFHEERLNEPLQEPKPSLIFAPSMGDLFTPSINDYEILRVLDAMSRARQHRFQVQTKFAKRLSFFHYPKNVWLGVSICYERDLPRLDYLRKTDARIKYAYCEPLLEEIDPDFINLDWIVIGAKTGIHKFQPQPLWVRHLTLKAYEVGAPVFHKPNLLYPNDRMYFPRPIRDFPDQEWFEWRKSLQDKK